MMIKKILAAILACVAIAGCVSCSSGKPKVDQDGNNDGTKVEDAPYEEHFIMHVKDRSPGKSYDKETNELLIDSLIQRASFTALDRINKPIKDNMNVVLNRAYERNVSNYNEFFVLLNEFEQSDKDKSEALFPWHLYTDYELIRNDGKVITVKETIDYFAGHPSGNSIITYYYNFDALTGNTLPQILYTEGNDDERDEADNLIYNKLVEKYGEEAISYENVPSSFVESSIESWYFTENGITLYFNEQTIAPAAAGTFEIEIAKSELPEKSLVYFLD